MPQIDLEPRRHSHLYEIKPMSRWYLVLASAFLALAVFVNGWDRYETWGLVIFSALFSGLLPMVFPKQLLSRPKD
jgi:hypothetical protein